MKKGSRTSKKAPKKARLSLRKIARKIKKIKSKIIRKPFKIKRVKQAVAPLVNELSKLQESPAPKNKGFELPETYGDNKLVLLVRDPWWFYAYWEITPEREKEILNTARYSGDAIETKVLRVYDITNSSWPKYQSFFDIKIGAAGNWYVDVGKPDGQWMAELGFRTYRGRFFALVRSNIVRTPRFGVSDVLDEEWLLPDELYWKIFGLSGGFGKQKSSMDIKEILNRYLRGLGASENSARLSSRSETQKSDPKITVLSHKVPEKF
ncbi:MAG: hypothetical protein AUJ72_01585 [Candidatus Omnitrophica bacterium CG1_02_46_14]|nr:MAG: hypothetical protein AUJ72_01585 [Candidatus Omnitrophica bacterium CG1_02_46_14]